MASLGRLVGDEAPVCGRLGNAPPLVSRTAAMQHREGCCPVVMASFALIAGPSGFLQRFQPSEAIITLEALSDDTAVLKTVYQHIPGRGKGCYPAIKRCPGSKCAGRMLSLAASQLKLPGVPRSED